MSPSRLIAVAVLAILLPACNGDATEEGEVTGEVLEGTISDEMLPLDQVRSEAPLADPTGARGGSGGVASDAADADKPAQTEAEPADEPAPERAEADE
ncbi:MAG: hypothetical protein ACO1OD_10060 [Croceibacterium sp.]